MEGKTSSMSNNALITSTNKDLAVYVHWNGGRDSVEAYLDYCHMHHFRSPETDSYGYARLCQVLGNFFGPDGLSVGVEPYPGDRAADDYDNGIYVIENWQIVNRYPLLPREQKTHNHLELLKAIDERQPEAMQLGYDYILSWSTSPKY